VNLPESLGTGQVALLFVLLFFVLILIFMLLNRRRAVRSLRALQAFESLERAVNLSVESGKRLHVSLGRGGVIGLPGLSGLVGLTILGRIASFASVGDRPPVATSGEGTLAILSQDTLRSASEGAGAEGSWEFTSGRCTGLTPFSYAAGTLPVVSDEGTSAHILAGHFGSEVALLTDAAERSQGLILAGSDNLSAQAVLYAGAQEPLVGEELYAAGAYIRAGSAHVASVHAQDVLRWVLVLAILAGVVLKLVGIL
jgi:uncharacterized protein DUF6754